MKKIDFRSLIPNLITLAGLSFGLSSIRFALELQFETAVVFIIFAAICDVLDGLVARVLNSQSELGAELDSLADFVNFGVAPGLILYMSIMQERDFVGSIAVLIYILFFYSLYLSRCMKIEALLNRSIKSFQLII